MRARVTRTSPVQRGGISGTGTRNPKPRMKQPARKRYDRAKARAGPGSSRGMVARATPARTVKVILPSARKCEITRKSDTALLKFVGLSHHAPNQQCNPRCCD